MQEYSIHILNQSKFEAVKALQMCNKLYTRCLGFPVNEECASTRHQKVKLSQINIYHVLFKIFFIYFHLYIITEIYTYKKLSNKKVKTFVTGQ